MRLRHRFFQLTVVAVALGAIALTESARLRRSAVVVRVIEIEEAQRQSAELGGVMARRQGVGGRLY